MKNQRPYGTCWTHAMISCIETNLIQNGYADIGIDLSELHLAYYMTHQSADPVGGYSGDTVTTKNYLRNGSCDNYSAAILSSWRGVTLEEGVPYNMASDDLVLGPSNEFSLTKYIITDAQFLDPYDRGASRRRSTAETGGPLILFFRQDCYNTIMDGDVRTVTYCAADEIVAMNQDVTAIGYDELSQGELRKKPRSRRCLAVKNS